MKPHVVNEVVQFEPDMKGLLLSYLYEFQTLEKQYQTNGISS